MPKVVCFVLVMVLAASSTATAQGVDPRYAIDQLMRNTMEELEEQRLDRRQQREIDRRPALPDFSDMAEPEDRPRGSRRASPSRSMVCHTTAMTETDSFINCIAD